MAIIRRDCPHCPTDQVAFQVTFSEQARNQGQRAWNCFATCGGCGKPICFVATAPPNVGPPTAFNGDIEVHWQVPQIWPSRTASVAPPHTPALVKRRFLEGEDAFRRGNWNSAVAMYRSALDIATKGMEGVPQNKQFFERLEWLHKNHGITPDIRSWADHVRVEGNAALHDPEEFSTEDAAALRFFSEMFLRYVFELPGAVREFREEPVPGAAPVPAA